MWYESLKRHIGYTIRKGFVEYSVCKRGTTDTRGTVKLINRKLTTPSWLKMKKNQTNNSTLDTT